jgi:hypothetical protein
MTDILLEPALSLPSLLSTALLESDEADSGVDFTPTAIRCDSREFGSANEDEDTFGDDPPSMTLREILLNADASHFHLLGLSNLHTVTNFNNVCPLCRSRPRRCSDGWR